MKIPWYAIRVFSKKSTGSLCQKDKINDDDFVGTWEALEIAYFQATGRSVSMEKKNGLVYGWNRVFRYGSDPYGRRIYQVYWYFNPLYILARILCCD